MNQQGRDNVEEKVSYVGAIIEERLSEKKRWTPYEGIHSDSQKRLCYMMIRREGNEETRKRFQHSLLEVSKENLKRIRNAGISGFVLKEGEHYFFTTVPEDMYLGQNRIFYGHMCSYAEGCSRLTAASDEDGGCAKVRRYAKEIEEYPWITRGYETLNVHHPALVVGECHQYFPEVGRGTPKKVEDLISLERLWNMYGESRSGNIFI